MRDCFGRVQEDVCHCCLRIDQAKEAHQRRNSLGTNTCTMNTLVQSRKFTVCVTLTRDGSSKTRAAHRKDYNTQKIELSQWNFTQNILSDQLLPNFNLYWEDQLKKQKLKTNWMKNVKLTFVYCTLNSSPISWKYSSSCRPKQLAQTSAAFCSACSTFCCQTTGAYFLPSNVMIEWYSCPTSMVS